MKIKLLQLLFLISISTLARAADPPEEGRLLFTTRCAGCHNVNKVLTGPALAGVSGRHPTAWIVKFVQSSQSLVRSGDKDALSIFEKFNKVPMPDHPDITEQQITAILDYINTETREVAEKAPFSKPGKLRPDYRPVPLTSYWLYLGYVGVVLLMSAVLLLFVRVKMIERNAADNAYL